MAVLPTGSSQVSVMPQAATVDPRLLAVDNSRFFDGLNQGLGAIGRGLQIRGEATQQRELNESAGMRRRLGEIQLANAEEQLASVPAGRALRDLQLQAAKNQAQVPTLIQDFGTELEGGEDLSDPANPVYTDLAEISAQLKLDPVTGEQYTVPVRRVIKTASQVRAESMAKQAANRVAMMKAEADLVQARGTGPKKLGQFYDQNKNFKVLIQDPNAPNGVREIKTSGVWQNSARSEPDVITDITKKPGFFWNGTEWVPEFDPSNPVPAPVARTAPYMGDIQIIEDRFTPPVSGDSLRAIQPAAQPARARLTLDQLAQ